jgi:signal transduction histidine kinase
MISEELRELQRFAELGRYSACLLHEISNPLTAALLHLELSQQRSRSVRRARRNIKLLQRYVEAARQQVRQGSSKRLFLVKPQLQQLKPILLPLARRSQVSLLMGEVPRCRLYGDPVSFQQLINNLVSNAIEASGPGQRVWLDAGLESDQLILEVRDEAGGIDQELAAAVFEPFVTTKPGRGLGLGLVIVKYAVEELGGSIRLDNSPDSGVRFSLALPLSKF